MGNARPQARGDEAPGETAQLFRGETGCADETGDALGAAASVAGVAFCLGSGVGVGAGAAEGLGASAAAASQLSKGPRAPSDPSPVPPPREQTSRGLQVWPAAQGRASSQNCVAVPLASTHSELPTHTCLPSHASALEQVHGTHLGPATKRHPFGQMNGCAQMVSETWLYPGGHGGDGGTSARAAPETVRAANAPSTTNARVRMSGTLTTCALARDTPGSANNRTQGCSCTSAGIGTLGP